MLNNNSDLLVIIDMNNGFVNKGALSSPNVKALVPKMREFVMEQLDNSVQTIHYLDWHDEDCKEFNTYPKHCIKNTQESEVIKELDDNRIEKFYKNSTNGFFVKNPLDFKKNIYIIGCVTDICVFDFAHTTNKYIQEFNLDYTVNIIENLCATFDAPNHVAIEVHEKTICRLEDNGVNIISL